MKICQGGIPAAGNSVGKNVSHMKLIRETLSALSLDFPAKTSDDLLAPTNSAWFMTILSATSPLWIFLLLSFIHFTMQKLCKWETTMKNAFQLFFRHNLVNYIALDGASREATAIQCSLFKWKLKSIIAVGNHWRKLFPKHFHPHLLWNIFQFSFATGHQRKTFVMTSISAGSLQNFSHTAHSTNWNWQHNG